MLSTVHQKPCQRIILVFQVSLTSEIYTSVNLNNAYCTLTIVYNKHAIKQQAILMIH